MRRASRNSLILALNLTLLLFAACGTDRAVEELEDLDDKYLDEQELTLACTESVQCTAGEQCVRTQNDDTGESSAGFCYGQGASASTTLLAPAPCSRNDDCPVDRACLHPVEGEGTESYCEIEQLPCESRCEVDGAMTENACDTDADCVEGVCSPALCTLARGEMAKPLSFE